MSSIQEFWSRLSGSVHPDDIPVFSAHPDHSFDLRFPPPAFVGDLGAPIVILMSNGGYKAGVTEAEFRDDRSVSDYSKFLRGEQRTLPESLARYYSSGLVGAWIHSGRAVIVNAVAYRSSKLSNEPENKRVAEKLPSLTVHQQWLVQEVLPQASRNQRFVFVHRNHWWRVPKHVAGPCVVFSDPAKAEPNRQSPDRGKLNLAEEWLLLRKGPTSKISESLGTKKVLRPDIQKIETAETQEVVKILTELQRIGFRDDAFWRIHHHRKKGTKEKINSFRRYCDKYPSFQRDGTNELVYRRLIFVLDAAHHEMAVGQRADFVRLAERAWNAIPSIG